MRKQHHPQQRAMTMQQQLFLELQLLLDEAPKDVEVVAEALEEDAVVETTIEGTEIVLRPRIRLQLR